jgi:hypothetical protein
VPWGKPTTPGCNLTESKLDQRIVLGLSLMATAMPFDAATLEIAVKKLRADEPLTPAERALVLKRGEELMELEDAPPGVALGEPMDEDEFEGFCEGEVLAEADEREGRPGIPIGEVLAKWGIAWPPAATE